MPPQLFLFQRFYFKKEQPILILDIGSEAVKALVFKKEVGRIVLLGRSLYYLDPFRVWEPHLRISGGKDGQRFGIEMVQEFAAKAAKEALKMSGQKSADIVSSLTPTIFRAFLKTVGLSREKSRDIISSREERNILVRIRERAKELALAEMPEDYGSGPKDFSVAPKIINMAIDGYKVPSLRGFRGQDISATCLITVLPSVYLDKSGVPIFLRKAKRRRFKGFFHEALYFAHPAFSYQDGIFIDIGGNTTEIFVLQNGELFFTAQVMLGGRDFTKLVAVDFGVDDIRARELKESYALGRLSLDASSRLKGKFGPLILKWISELSEGLSKTQNPLPPVFYLFGGGALLQEFKQALERGLPGVPLAGDPKVNFLTPHDLPGIENIEILANSAHETPTLLLAYLV